MVKGFTNFSCSLYLIMPKSDIHFQEKFNNPYWNWFRKLKSPPTKLVCFFPFTCRPGSYVRRPILPVIAPRMDTFLLAQKRVGPTSPKSDLLQYLCHATVWWYPFSRMALCISTFKPFQQALHTQIAITFNELQNLSSVSFFKCRRTSLKFCLATWKCHYKGPHTT